MRTVPIAIFALACAACSGGEPDPDPVSPAVYDRIEAMDRCPDLQAEFDAAETHGHAQVMEAADARMKAIGCY